MNLCDRNPIELSIALLRISFQLLSSYPSRTNCVQLVHNHSNKGTSEHNLTKKKELFNIYLIFI